MVVVLLGVIAYLTYVIAKFAIVVLTGNTISTIIDKWLSKPYKEKKYDFDNATRIPLTSYKRYCSKEYQKMFKNMH